MGDTREPLTVESIQRALKTIAEQQGTPILIHPTHIGFVGTFCKHHKNYDEECQACVDELNEILADYAE